jgi:hypothetical protein
MVAKKNKMLSNRIPNKDNRSPIGNGDKSKNKTSFYISKSIQHRLKRISETYEMSQGDVIDLAAKMLDRIAPLSLERREKSLATLRILDKQIRESIAAMESIAPHLRYLLEYPADMISELIDLEEKAVKEKVIEGLRIRDNDNVPHPLNHILYEPYKSEPAAYEKDLIEILGLNMQEKGEDNVSNEACKKSK